MDRKWTLVAGALLILIGVLLTLDDFYIIRFDLWDTLGKLWPLALIAVGIWLIYRRSSSSVGDCTTSDTGKISRLAGRVRSKPNSLDERGLDIQLGFGSIEIDLTSTNLRDGVNSVEASVGIGEVRVNMPKEVTSSVSGTCGIGDVHLIDESSNGFSPRLSRTDPGYDSAELKIKLEVRSGLGEIKVTRE